MTGCVSGRHYQATAKTPAEGAQILVQNFVPDLHRYGMVALDKVDGRDVGYFMVYHGAVLVDPGERLLTVYGFDRDYFVDRMGTTTLKATLLAGHAYHLEGVWVAPEKQFDFWLEDATNGLPACERQSVNGRWYLNIFP